MKSERIRIFERSAIVYDVLMPNGKVYRWDDAQSARNFIRVNRSKPMTKGLSEQMLRQARRLADRTTPDELVRKRVTRKLVRGEPHEVSKS